MKDREAISITIDEPLEDIFPILKESVESRGARFVEILDRGLISSRLSVPLPANVHGEWVHNDPASIAAKQALGYIIDTRFAASKALHTDGTGKAIIGDVIFMICPKQIKDEIERARQIRYRLDNNPNNPKEDRQTAAELTQFGRPDHIAPLPIENQLTQVSGPDISAAISSK